MTQPKKPAEAKPVTIEVRQPIELKPNLVRWGDRVYGPGRRLEVPKDQLDELEGEYDEVDEE
jgi:hypothetical protein